MADTIIPDKESAFEYDQQRRLFQSIRAEKGVAIPKPGLSEGNGELG